MGFNNSVPQKPFITGTLKPAFAELSDKRREQERITDFINCSVFLAVNCNVCHHVTTRGRTCRMNVRQRNTFK